MPALLSLDSAVEVAIPVQGAGLSWLNRTSEGLLLFRSTLHAAPHGGRNNSRLLLQPAFEGLEVRLRKGQLNCLPKPTKPSRINHQNQRRQKFIGQVGCVT